MPNGNFGESSSSEERALVATTKLMFLFYIFEAIEIFENIITQD
jgi:hypothetical protein